MNQTPFVAVALAIALAAGLAATAHAQPPAQPVIFDALYAERCSVCHGGNLEGAAQGTPLAGNVKFFTALSCRVRVVDLHRSLCAEPIESRRAEAMPALLEQLLPLSPDDRYDAVLAWDVFDYMRIDQVKPLMARIVPRLRPHAQVLVLASMQSQIPAVPLRYRIVDRDHLDSEAPGREADFHRPISTVPRQLMLHRTKMQEDISHRNQIH